MIRAAAIVLSRSIYNIVQARRRNSVKRWHLFLWRVMTRIASICLSILGESCVKSELILGCLFFLSWAKIMERNVEGTLQNISSLWIWLIGQMASVCKNFIYLLPEKPLKKGLCKICPASSQIYKMCECSTPFWSSAGMTQSALDFWRLNTNMCSNSKMLSKICFYSLNNSIQGWK